MTLRLKTRLTLTITTLVLVVLSIVSLFTIIIGMGVFIYARFIHFPPVLAAYEAKRTGSINTLA
jgi:hypothetical protein